jgi:hypothetical protein
MEQMLATCETRFVDQKKSKKPSGSDPPDPG